MTDSSPQSTQGWGLCYCGWKPGEACDCSGHSQTTPYQLGWDEGYAEGYGAKLVDVTELFMPAGVDHEVEAAAMSLADHRGLQPCVSLPLDLGRSM